MKFNKTADGKNLTVYLKGEVDALSATPLEEELLNIIPGVQDLIFDLRDLTYISSAGLRVLLMTQKMVKSNNGSMTVIHPSEDVMDVFRVTGFVRLFNIAK